MLTKLKEVYDSLDVIYIVLLMMLTVLLLEVSGAIVFLILTCINLI